ncbi:hypothetical protein HMPREF0497_0551 [Lentilactobacillus buchneri ATCC 11577]|uniref:hypothetical protein n=1 Tax=Lentilactobacillus hilgardii TaxID=1588 RepID=UPI00019C4625|nr:hypothetical protein [Lentilactobacillus hilgardii]EEI20692.1 hypothetical protein HMPREF0497_0551 [Lentilactobacillus buchneri ATCC 11577]MCT3394947.1 hypothetical protein [Lentilactobacillus hilgardii]
MLIKVAQRYRRLTIHYILLLLGIVEFIRLWEAGQLISINMLLLISGMALILIDGVITFLKIKQKKFPIHQFLK